MRRLALLLVGLGVLLPASAQTHALSAQGRTHAVIIVGLGGSEEFRQSSQLEASTIYDALVNLHGLPLEDVTYLGEKIDLARGSRLA